MTLSAALFTLPANALWQWWFIHPQDVFGPRMAYPLAVLLLLLGLIRQGPAAEDRDGRAGDTPGFLGHGRRLTGTSV